MKNSTLGKFSKEVYKSIGYYVYRFPILALCRSLNSAIFDGDGGCLCVMGGGCSDATELGRGRKSCFYSCYSCFQFNK